jgi:hypothetical protein
VSPAPAMRRRAFRSCGFVLALTAHSIVTLVSGRPARPRGAEPADRFGAAPWNLNRAEKWTAGAFSPSSLRACGAVPAHSNRDQGSQPSAQLRVGAPQGSRQKKPTSNCCQSSQRRLGAAAVITTCQTKLFNPGITTTRTGPKVTTTGWLSLQEPRWISASISRQTIKMQAPVSVDVLHHECLGRKAVRPAHPTPSAP